MTWPVLPLSDLLAVPLTNGRSVPTEAGGFPVLRLTALRNGHIDLRERKDGAWTRADAERFLVRSGDFLVSRGNGTLDLVGRGGLVGAVADAVAYPDTMIRVRPDVARLDPRFLALAWNAPDVRRQIEMSARTTAGIYKVNQSHLGAVTLPVPPLDEQHHIVDLLEAHLSRLDAAEHGLETALVRCEALLTSSLLQATHGLPEAESVELQSIAEVRLGRQRSPKNHSGDRMRPYLRAANVDWDRLRLDDVKEMQFTEADEETYRLRRGDILLTEASGSPAEVGKSVIYRGIPADVCFQNTLLRVRCHSANPDFVQTYLLAEARAGRFMPEARGVGINHLSRTRLATLSIDLPSSEVQREAVARCRDLVDEVTRLKTAVTHQASRNIRLRRSLLAAAFSGRLTGTATDLSVPEGTIPA